MNWIGWANVEDPKPYIPETTSRRGRKHRRYRTEVASYEIKKVVEDFGLSKEPIVKLRETTRGPLKVRALRLDVYIWDGTSSQARRFSLLATQTIGEKPETKISLSNAPETMDLKTLAWMQLQRYWVERAFEDAKSECGMADYQVRKWSAWHHYMALVMMTMLFMLDE